jgi:hypothetical protein
MHKDSLPSGAHSHMHSNLAVPTEALYCCFAFRVILLLQLPCCSALLSANARSLLSLNIELLIQPQALGYICWPQLSGC